MKESVVTIQVDISLQQSKLAQLYDLVSINSTHEALKLIQNNKQKILSVILGPNIKDPIQTSQRLYGIVKDISVFILTQAENVESLRKSISFTPFLGNSTVCLSETNLQQLEIELTKAVSATLSIRQAKNLSHKLNSQLTGILSDKQKSAISSREYIERLFDSAPIGIMTLSSEGNFLSLNKASSEMFGITEQGSVGAPVQKILPGLNLIPDGLVSISKEIYDEQRHFEITITTVHGEDQSLGFLLLVVDNTDKKKYENALEVAVKVRDEFLSIASHELRTPITSLQLQLQMTKRSIQSSEQSIPAILSKVIRSTDIALIQLQRLTLLVEELLDVSRIEAGKLSFNYTKVNISELLREVTARLSHQATLANCKIELDVPDELTFISDPFRLDQVITNLLVNAFKYAAGKPVELKVTEYKTSIEITVKDYGMGIEPSKLSSVFKRFERGISHDNISGLGLGLYITKSIVDAHNGTISVASELGEGSTFTVSLPKQQAGQ